MGSATVFSPLEAEKMAPYGITAERVAQSRLLATFYAGAKILSFTQVVTWGSRIIGVAVFAGSLMLGMVGLLAPRRVFGLRLTPRPPLLALAFCVVPAWYGLFPNHTIQHAPFMVRILVWPLIAGLLLFASRLPRVAPAVTSPPVPHRPVR
jgi:hypothetical protein